MGVLLFSKLLPVDVAGANFQQRQDAFADVVLFSSLWVFTVGILIALFLKEEQTTATTTLKQSTWRQLKTAIQFPTMGMLILIVLCAYIGYKVTDILSLFAAEVMAFDEVAAAQVGSYQMYLRPIICVIIGELADKSSNSRWLLRGFAVLFLGAALFSAVGARGCASIVFCCRNFSGPGNLRITDIVLCCCTGGQIPYVHMGTAVGIISVIGYTPDVFMGPLMGYLLDHFPGLVGTSIGFWCTCPCWPYRHSSRVAFSKDTPPLKILLNLFTRPMGSITNAVGTIRVPAAAFCINHKLNSVVCCTHFLVFCEYTPPSKGYIN